MLKSIREHKSYLDYLLTSTGAKVDWQKVLSDHERKIGYFQAERLIHLIVTMFVNLFTVLSFFTSFFISKNEIYFLTLVLIVLSTAYLYHYYQLENNVQSLYKYSSEILRKINSE